MLSEPHHYRFGTRILSGYSVVLQFQSSRLWVSPGCPVGALPLSRQGLGSPVTHPGGSLPCARLQAGMRTAALLAENSSHRLGWCTQGNPALATAGICTSSNLALQCSFPVLQQCLNGPGSLKYLSAAVHHIPLPIGSTVNGTLQKQAAPLGCQKVCGLVQGSGK